MNSSFSQIVLLGFIDYLLGTRSNPEERELCQDISASIDMQNGGSLTQVCFQVFAGHTMPLNAIDLTLAILKGCVYLEQFRWDSAKLLRDEQVLILLDDQHWKGKLLSINRVTYILSSIKYNEVLLIINYGKRCEQVSNRLGTSLGQPGWMVTFIIKDAQQTKTIRTWTPVLKHSGPAVLPGDSGNTAGTDRLLTRVVVGVVVGRQCRLHLKL